MGEFRVSDKAPTKKGSTNNSVIGSGLKVQSLEAFTNSKMTMMLNHNHHHRPFDNDDDDDAGPTTYMSFSGSSSAPLGAAITIDGCGAAVIRPPLQPFDVSAYTSATTTTLKSPAAGGMAASSLGFPFTGAQWKELQRQAMIYKYMMASVPVPSDLLIPTTTTTSLDGGFNLRLSSSSSTDPEPGRCRRTDGKKWRCSRDVAPNHKYCERHMHRGRPRSRKPVEVHPNNNHQIKRARHDSNPNFPVPDVTVAIPNPTTRKDGSSSHFLASTTSHPYFQSSLSLDNNFGVKGLNFGSVASVSSNKQPRGLEWMLNGDPISLGASDSGWQSLMHNKVATNTGGSCNNTEPQYLNSLALYSYGLDQQDRRLPMFLNPLVAPMESFESEKPRGFIDAWSNSEAANANANANNKNSAAASIGKLSLSSLDLSMGGGAVHEEEMGNIGMGLGLMEPDRNTHNDDTTKISLSNWLNPAAPWGMASTPGGPLAEVLRPSTVTATSDAISNQSSPVITSGPLGTMASSPSGVLHKTFASLSDSSGNSSPTVASSRVNSEIALLKFNQM